MSVKHMKNLFQIGWVSAIAQLVVIVGGIIVMAGLGSKPDSAAEFYAVYQTSPIQMVLRGDVYNLILIGLYLGTFPALYIALRRINPVASAFATLFTIVTVVLCFATEPTFSLLHLAEKFAAAGSEAARAQLLAAGEAVIATDMWNSSAAYMSGILLQGAGVIISVVMLRSPHFSKLTAYSGLLANGIDLFQHVVHPFWPQVGEVLGMVFGLFYVVWFVMLARDFVRLAKQPAALVEVSA